MNLEVPTTMTMSSAVVISDDNLGLWHDQAGTDPVTSLEFTGVQFQPPLDSISDAPGVWVFIENRSDIDLTLIAPCGDVDSPPGTRIGSMDVDLVDIPSGDSIGNTCDRDVTLAPGEMVRGDVHIHLEGLLGDGHYDFSTVFGASGEGEGSVITKFDDSDEHDCDTDCSLREAIEAASVGDTINIPAGTYTLTTGAELVIDKSLNLSGDAVGTIIEAATEPNVASARVFHITDGEVAISDVTIRHGDPDSSVGGIWNDGATLSLTNTLVSSNGGTLGAVLNCGGGTMTVTDSSVIDNSGTADSAGILNCQNAAGAPRNTLTVVNSTISENGGRGLWNGGTLTVSNTTISGNSYGGHGAGIYNFSCCGNENATATVVNSTIEGNLSSSKSGIWNNQTITVANTIIAGNMAPSQPDCNDFTSLGHNLIGDTSGCSFTPAAGDLLNVEAMLGPLSDNRGPTPTHALLPDSPAIDAGDDNVAPVIDQRGVARVGTSDIGAYEFEP